MVSIPVLAERSPVSAARAQQSENRVNLGQGKKKFSQYLSKAANSKVSQDTDTKSKLQNNNAVQEETLQQETLLQGGDYQGGLPLSTAVPAVNSENQVSQTIMTQPQTETAENQICGSSEIILSPQLQTQADTQSNPLISVSVETSIPTLQAAVETSTVGQTEGILSSTISIPLPQHSSERPLTMAAKEMAKIAEDSGITVPDGSANSKSETNTINQNSNPLLKGQEQSPFSIITSQDTAKENNNQTLNYGSMVQENSETNQKTDVKNIIAMESHIRPKVKTAEITVDQTENQFTPDNAKSSLLPNQTDMAQTRETKPFEPVTKEIEPKALIEQIVQKAEVMLKSDNSEMKIQLKPEFMGKMLIKVSVEDGTVVAKIITDNQHVKQALETNLNTLRQSLEANGMKVEKTEVSVQLSFDSGGSFTGSDGRNPLWAEQQGQNHQFMSGSNYDLAGVEELPEAAETPNYYGINSEGQVNYLI